jgi:single-stranded-DNA-specific exonuclease
MSEIVWELSEQSDEQTINQLSQKLNISRTLTRILANRGLTDRQKINEFLNPSLDKLYNPLLMKDMDKAILRINSALKNREKILVYGDYDVDGITGTSIVVSGLKELGGSVSYYIPNRDEGYGLNTTGINQAKQNGIKLIITVDCGISSCEEVEHAKALGIETIITDHHEPPADLPKAVALVNPKRKDGEYPYKELAGAGVAFKLITALYISNGIPSKARNHLDLAALGTIADVVPLMDENRILVKHGLQMINKYMRPGIKAVLSRSGFDIKKNINAEHAAFIISPRLNALGRLRDAGPGVELLITEDNTKTEQLADQIEMLNRERQKIESKITEDARCIINNSDLKSDKIIVVSHEDWHPGVIGIAASRIAEEYHKPTVLITIAQGKGRGSARSIPGFNIFEALGKCSCLLKKYGGHEMAAGFEIDPPIINDFKRILNHHALKIPQSVWLPKIKLDAYINSDEINLKLASEIEKLEPFGAGNPQPIFATNNMMITGYKWVGKSEDHLKVKLSSNGKSYDAIGFRFDNKKEIKAGACADVVYALNINQWNGYQNIQMVLKQLRVVSKHEYEFKNVLRLIYKCLRRFSANKENIEVKSDDLAVHINQRFGISLTTETIDLCLNIFEEMKLITKNSGSSLSLISIKESKGIKVDLCKSKIYRNLLKTKLKAETGGR